VVALAPQNPAGYELRARLGLQYGLSADPQAIRADLDRAVELAPTSGQAYFWRGWAILNFPLGAEAPDPSAALADLQKAVELEPKDGEAQLTLARALLAAGRAPDALAPASRAIEISPQSGLPRALRARIRFVLGDFHSAIDDLTLANALEADPVQSATLLAERGYLHLRLQTSSEAQNDLGQALSRDPSCLLAHYLQMLLDPARPRPPAEQIRKAQSAAGDDPIWQAVMADLLPAP